MRSHDPEEAIRHDVIVTIINAGKKDLNLVNDQLLGFVRERMLDKRVRLKHFSSRQSIDNALNTVITWKEICLTVLMLELSDTEYIHFSSFYVNRGKTRVGSAIFTLKVSVGFTHCLFHVLQWRVRKEAMMGLAQLYKKYCLHHEAGKESAQKISWIKDKLLHIYYQNSIDDK